MRKIKFIFGILLIPIFLVISLALAVLVYPSLVINDTTWSLGQKILSRSHIVLTEDRFHVSAQSLNLRDKKLFLHFENLCVSVPHPWIHGCFPLVDVAVKFRLERPAVKILRIESLRVNSQFFTLRLEPRRAVLQPSKPSSFSVADLFPSDLRKVLLHELVLDLKNNDIVLSPSEELKGDVSFTDVGTLKAFPWSGRFEARAQESQKGHVVNEASLHLQLSGQGETLGGPVTVTGTLTAQHGGLQTPPVQLTAHLLGPGEVFDLQASAENFCLNPGVAPVSGCVQKFQVGLEGQGNLSHIHLTRVNPLVLKADRLTADLRTIQPPPTAINTSAPVQLGSGEELANSKKQIRRAAHTKPARLWPSILSQMNLGSIDVMIRRLRLQTDSGVASAHLDIDNHKLHLTLMKKSTSTSPGAFVAARGWLNIDAPKSQLQYRLTWTADQKPWEAQGVFKGRVTNGEVDSQFQVTAKKGNISFTAGSPKFCSAMVSVKGRASVDCDLETTWNKKFIVAEMPQHLNAHLHGALTAPFPFSTQDPWTADVGLNIVPVKNPLFDLGGIVGLKIKNQVLGEHPLDKLQLTDDLHLKVADFQKLILAFKDTEFFPPAPFNVFGGRVDFSSRGTFACLGGRVPLDLKFDLDSPGQSFKGVARASVGLKETQGLYAPDFKGSVVFDDVQLALPHFDLAVPPPLTPDGRIQRKAEMILSSSVSSLHYDFDLSTAKPVRLISNLANAPIPISFNLHLVNGQPIKGKVRVESFPVTLFHRRTKIQFLEISLITDRMDEDPISGDVIMAYTDYVIHILFSGNIKQPLISLESDPPLPNDEIVSVMLFGQPPGNLTTDQTNSVVNMQAAMGNRALGLFSLFFLGSTPIESIGYDPGSQLFTAKIKLKNDVSLDVGSANGSSLGEVGLNKRLGHSWYIKTFYTGANPVTGESQSVTAFLERVFRY